MVKELEVVGLGAQVSNVVESNVTESDVGGPGVAKLVAHEMDVDNNFIIEYKLNLQDYKFKWICDKNIKLGFVIIIERSIQILIEEIFYYAVL